MWHQRRFLRPKQETPNVGLTVVETGSRMVSFALHDLPDQVYAEAAGLDDGQLRRLAKAAWLVRQAAYDALDGRTR